MSFNSWKKFRFRSLLKFIICYRLSVQFQNMSNTHQWYFPGKNNFHDQDQD